MDARSWLLESAAAPPAPAGPPQPWRWWLPGVAGALGWLAAHGLKAGMRIGLAGANLPACAALLQAAPLAGLTTVLFNRRLSAAALGAQLRESACAVLVTTPGGAAADAGPAALVLPEAFAADAPHPPPSPLRPEQAALVLFSSGTSGPPKAVRLSMAALGAAAAGAVERLALVRGDHWLCCLPLDHIGGASVVLRAGLCGYALTLVERFAAASVDQLLGQGVTGMSVVPTMLHRLVAERAGRAWPPTLRVLLTGGGALAGDLAERTRRLGVTACETYGLTEAASQVCTSAPAAASPGSCGTPLPGMQLRIRRSDGALAGGGGGMGIIEIAGAALFDGYERHGELVGRHPRGAWFATGDLGELDGAGRLRVLGRHDDLINSGGEKIDPAGIEAVLCLHPAILEAGVHGTPDAQWGEVVSAVLVARGAPPPAAELQAWCAERLGGFRSPRRWRFVDHLPRTATGKLQRRLLAAWPHGAAGAAASDPSA